MEITYHRLYAGVRECDLVERLRVIGEALSLRSLAGDDREYHGLLFRLLQLLTDDGDEGVGR